MSITAIIPHYFTERVPSLVAGVEALQQGTVTPEEILIWDNTGVLQGPILGASIISSPRNIGPQARFVASLCATGDLIFFQDNDVAVQARTLEMLRIHVDAFPNALASLEGRRVTPAGTYRKSTWLRGDPHRAETADISLGRGEMIAAPVLYHALRDFPWASRALMDDLWFSYCCRRAGVPIVVLRAVPDAGLVQLNEFGVGSRFDEDHYRLRDELCWQFFGDDAKMRKGIL